MGLAEKILSNAGLRECRHRRVVVLVSGEEYTFDVRQPLLNERDEIVRPKKMKVGVDPAGKPVIDAVQKPNSEVWADAVIACAIDPETQAPAFRAEHREALLRTPANGWVQELGEAVLALVQPEPDAGKDFAAIPNGNSSTP